MPQATERLAAIPPVLLPGSSALGCWAETGRSTVAGNGEQLSHTGPCSGSGGHGRLKGASPCSCRRAPGRLVSHSPAAGRNADPQHAGGNALPGTRRETPEKTRGTLAAPRAEHQLKSESLGGEAPVTLELGRNAGSQAHGLTQNQRRGAEEVVVQQVLKMILTL